MAWHDEWPHKVCASVLLLDGKIEGWKTGYPPKTEPCDFKAYWKKDRLNDYTVEHTCFEVNNDSEHNDAFRKLSPEWFRQWKLADDLHGSPPYSDENVVEMQDKTRYSPGPWKYLERMCAVYDDEGWQIARIFNHEGNGEADANLIATAPEMYEALRKFKEHITWVMTCTTEEELGKSVDWICGEGQTLIDEVLIKAQGGQSCSSD